MNRAAPVAAVRFRNAFGPVQWQEQGETSFLRRRQGEGARQNRAGNEHRSRNQSWASAKAAASGKKVKAMGIHEFDPLRQPYTV